MGGFDDQVAIMGDWMASSPGPKGFYSSLISDDVVSRSIGDSNSENKPWSHFVGPGAGNADHKDQNLASNFNTLAEPKSGYRGGLLERRAGFNAQKLNTEIIRPTEFRKEPEVRSPLFAFPPGLISPTSLLDSPVFLSNSLVLPSPTTGKFSFAPSVNHRNSTLMADDSDHGKGNTFEDANASSFAFKPIQDSSSFPYFNAVNKVNNDGPFQPASVSESHGELNRGSNLTSEHSLPLHEMHEDDGDPESGEDGYNWRKYGQKQVKRNEYPPCYYKCTHPNCQVKKKVERSHEGHITEIIYKGAHEHPKPPPNRRSAFDSSNSPSESQLDSEQSNGDQAWSTVLEGNTVGPADWSQENLEATSVGQEYVNGNGAKYEPLDGVDGFSTLSNNEDGDDRSTQGGESLVCDGEGEELESKKRRIETYASDVSGATRAVRKPRVVVQTTSEMDILDDGYRWRKYGQKIVKGNPNPRSYYKCTSPGCNVRKHVERASQDLKSVITTYEGKHNHDVPAARNSSHNNSLRSTTIPTQQTPAGSNHIQRPEPSQIRMARFERPSLVSYGFPGRPPLGPGPGFGYGVNQPGLASVGMAGLGSSVPVNPNLQHQARPMNDMAFMVPKGEPKLDPVMDSGLNHSSVSAYQQFMCRLPLGPQM